MGDRGQRPAGYSRLVMWGSIIGYNSYDGETVIIYGYLMIFVDIYGYFMNMYGYLWIFVHGPVIQLAAAYLRPNTQAWLPCQHSGNRILKKRKTGLEDPDFGKF